MKSSLMSIPSLRPSRIGFTTSDHLPKFSFSSTTRYLSFSFSRSQPKIPGFFSNLIFKSFHPGFSYGKWAVLEGFFERLSHPLTSFLLLYFSFPISSLTNGSSSPRVVFPNLFFLSYSIILSISVTRLPFHFLIVTFFQP